MRGSPELIALGKAGRGEDRFTNREMIETEQQLSQAAEVMAARERHRVAESDRDGGLARASQRGLNLSGEQQATFEHVTGKGGLSLVIGYAGTGKSAMLGVARGAWEDAGFHVRGVALSGIAAEGLENGSGIASRTIASMEHGWAQGRDLLSSRDVLVIDEAGMSGMAVSRSPRCAVSASTGNAMPPGIWRPAGPVRRLPLMPTGAWCIRPGRVSRREPNWSIAGSRATRRSRRQPHHPHSYQRRGARA